MIKLFKLLGFLFSWVAPFSVIYINHVVLVDASFDVDMFGLLLALGMILGFVKWLDNKCKVWEIQDRNKLLRLNWSNGKKILFASGLTWILYTIENDLDKMQWSGVLITTCFIIGWIFTMLANLKSNRNKTL